MNEINYGYARRSYYLYSVLSIISVELLMCDVNMSGVCIFNEYVFVCASVCFPQPCLLDRIQSLQINLSHSWVWVILRK